MLTRHPQNTVLVPSVAYAVLAVPGIAILDVTSLVSEAVVEATVALATTTIHPVDVVVLARPSMTTPLAPLDVVPATMTPLGALTVVQAQGLAHQEVTMILPETLDVREAWVLLDMMTPPVAPVVLVLAAQVQVMTTTAPLAQG